MPQLTDGRYRRHTRFDLSLFDEDADIEAPDGQRGEAYSPSPSPPLVKPQRTKLKPAKGRVDHGRVIKPQGEGLKTLHLVDAVARLPSRLSKYKSPWETFQRVLDYAYEEDRVIMVQDKFHLERVFALRKFALREFDRIEQRFKRLEHENIVTAKGFFRLDQTCFVLSDFFDLSLMEIVGCPEYPTERELSCIIGQVNDRKPMNCGAAGR
jgi:hypothetical protein